MILIHATKKLYARLPVDAQGLLPGTSSEAEQAVTTSANPLSGWHANLITLQRHNCILLVHDATRFPVFIKSLRKPDFANLNLLFADALMNTLLKLDASEQQLQMTASLLAPCQFDTNCSRSVLGTLNQMAGEVEYMLWYDRAKLEDISAYKAGAWLADRPCSVKGMKDCIWPKDAMLALLSPKT